MFSTQFLKPNVVHSSSLKTGTHFTQSGLFIKMYGMYSTGYTIVLLKVWLGRILHVTYPVFASVCRSVSPLSPLPDSSWDSWVVCAELEVDSSRVAEAGLLVSMGDPSSCDTPTIAGSEVSTMSGLREAGEGKVRKVGNQLLKQNSLGNYTSCNRIKQHWHCRCVLTVGQSVWRV